ncbi:hypothetical protein [Pseudofulvibacter geojedonensis]|uniref:Anti-sigma factor n=1 Tax=Pseudofulvibacter geojedonensis TaxID=1123758 RepID=A0ABW3I0Y2_9FLAO
MGHDNIDKEIKKKLEGRLIEPSANVWDKLDELLEKEESNKNKRTPFYWVAASVVLLLGLFFVLNGGDDNRVIEPIVVEVDNEKTDIIKDELLVSPSKEDEKQEVFVDKSKEVIVKQNKQLRKIEQHIKKNNQELPTAYEINDVGIKEQDELMVSSHQQEENVNKSDYSLDLEVDSLLAAATASINLDKEEETAIPTAKTTIDPNALLADVEEELDMSFKEKVFKKIKSGFKKTKTAVAKRND